MDFIISNKKLQIYKENISLNDTLYLSYSQNNLSEQNELVLNNSDFLLLSNANSSFIHLLKQDDALKANIEKLIPNLENGYIIFYNKKTAELKIYNDIFGFYHLFYIYSKHAFYISSGFDNLISFSNQKVNTYAILDLLLFNYTLLDRTLLSDIKRLQGGSQITIHQNNFEIHQKNNFAKNFKVKKKKVKPQVKEFAVLIKETLNNEINNVNKVVLTMTAGFDSRALLSALKNLDLDFYTVTFGQQGNIEQETIKDFIGKYSKGHQFLKLDNNFIDNIDSLLRNYCSKNLDNPVLLDLLHYLYLNNELETSNLVTGFMGGEFITGQSVGSQVTFTGFAAEMLKAEKLDDLKPIFYNEIRKLKFLNINEVKNIEREYFESISIYLKEENNLNILRFLINEKYAKFFGAVNKLFRNNVNLVIPFMSSKLIEYVLNSKISFLEKKPFSNNPFLNFKAKIFYAKTIKFLYPLLAKTKFDRLYTVDDLCMFYKIPNAAIGYIQSHLLKINKKNYPRPHHYDEWYKEIVLGSVNKNRVSLLCNKSSLTENEYNLAPSVLKKKYATMAGILISLDLISEKTNQIK